MLRANRSFWDMIVPQSGCMTVHGERNNGDCDAMHVMTSLYNIHHFSFMSFNIHHFSSITSGPQEIFLGNQTWLTVLAGFLCILVTATQLSFYNHSSKYHFISFSNCLPFSHFISTWNKREPKAGITELMEISEHARNIQQHSSSLQHEQDCCAEGHPMIQSTQCLVVVAASRYNIWLDFNGFLQ